MMLWGKLSIITAAMFGISFGSLFNCSFQVAAGKRYRLKWRGKVLKCKPE